MAYGLRLAAYGLGAVGVLLAVAAPSVQGGLYTTEQAERGQALYDEKCTSCHGGLRDLTPGMVALLGDHTFRSQWTGRPLGELFGMIQETMPQDAPGTLSPGQSADLVAYILSGHRFPAGESALTTDVTVLMEIPFER